MLSRDCVSTIVRTFAMRDNGLTIDGGTGHLIERNIIAFNGEDTGYGVLGWQDSYGVYRCNDVYCGVKQRFR